MEQKFHYNPPHLASPSRGEGIQALFVGGREASPPRWPHAEWAASRWLRFAQVTTVSRFTMGQQMHF